MKHQILSQISCCINLIPGNCAIAELVTTCRYSGFWQNEHVFSCFTVLVTVTYVIQLLRAGILVFGKMNMFSHVLPC